MQTITCPICEELMNHVQKKPFWHPCGGVCCETCVSPTCVFCGENHEDFIKELTPLVNIFLKKIILCRNQDGTAVFIESNTFFPYCERCKGQKVGVDIEDDFFQCFFEGYLDKVGLVNEEVFESVVKKVNWVRDKENWQKLRIVKILAQFLNGQVFCDEHMEMRAIGVDLDLRFRCGFCGDVDDVVDLEDVWGCRRYAGEFVKRRIEDERVMVRLKDYVIWSEGIGSVKIVLEILLALEIEKDLKAAIELEN